MDTQQFCYDDLSRLTWAGTNGTPPCSGTAITAGTLASAQYQQSDSYDVDGRLSSGPSGSYTYGDTSHPHAVTSTSKGYSAAYDAAGNMTCRALTTATTCSGTPTAQQLSYDAEGRLSSWQNQPASPSQAANYLYDGSGNRVAMQSTVNGTTTLTAYIGTIEEVQTTGSTTQTTTYYTVGGERIAASVNGTFYYFGYDALGSQVVVLNSSGSVSGAQLYGPYGSSRYSTGTLPTSIGFTGQYNDSLTGLDYYNARSYDPVVGVFLSADTVQGNASGMNPYAYVGGNPETYVDPTGERFAPPPCGPDGCSGGGGGSVGSAGGGGAGSAPPVWQGNLQPYLTSTTGTSIMTHGATDVSNLSSCGGFSSADCLKANWAAQTQVQGYVVVNRPFSGGSTGGQPVCLGMGVMSMCTSLPGSSTGINVPSVMQVSGTAVTPTEGCATLFACLAQNEGAGEEKPVDGVEELCSFTSRTAVTTERGKRPIGTVHKGERVLAYNPQTHKMELQPILHVWINHDHDLVDLILTTTTKAQHSKASTKTSETIHTNQRHPFLTAEKGFVTVGQLKVGMRLVRAGGGVGVITGWKLVPGVMTMYNLEVAQDHTFTVGDGQWVVHNCGIVDINLSRGDYPETAQHIEDSIANGQPDVLTLNRSAASANRRASLRGIPTKAGFDRDEYPMAFTSEGGKGADVRYVSSSDNRGAGSVIGQLLSSFPDGTKFRINITP